MKFVIHVIVFFIIINKLAFSQSNTKKVIVFDDVIIASNEKSKDVKAVSLFDGSLILKEVLLPILDKKTIISAKLSLESMGCKWSRVVSCFLIKKQDTVANLYYSKKNIKLPQYPQANSQYGGIVLDGEYYYPNIELIRAVTPFGIGFYNNAMLDRKPVYVPKWEQKVVWVQDVSDLVSELEGKVFLGIKIDNPDGGGFKVRLELTFTETSDPKHRTWVESVINTLPYIPEQKTPDVFSKQDVEAIVNIPKGVKNIRLKYIATGHGMQTNSDEFSKRLHLIDINGREVYRDTLWRDDCATFRRFNPHAGIWTEKIIWQGKEFQERMSSSDYSRSNWCPGSDVTPVTIPILPLPIGANSLRFSIPNARKDTSDDPNYWLVSAYLLGDY